MLKTITRIPKAVVHRAGRAYVRLLTNQDFQAQKFTRHNERPIEFGFVLEQIAQLRPITVLDVGSGDTAFPHIISNCGCVVTATDNVSDYWTSGMFNRHWTVIDDNILKSKITQRFDMVTCVSVIEHIVDHQTAFQNMTRLVRPGGHLVVTTPYSEHNPVPNVYKLEGAAYGQHLPYQCRSTSRKELDSWIESTGVELVRQDFWRLWSGRVWTQGHFLPRPEKVGREDPHQLSLMVFRV